MPAGRFSAIAAFCICLASLAACQSTRDKTSSFTEPPAPAPATRAAHGPPVKAAIYVQSNETTGEAAFPIIVEVQNLTDKPMSLSVALYSDLSVGRPSRPPEELSLGKDSRDTIIPVLQANVPQVLGRRVTMLPLPAEATRVPGVLGARADAARRVDLPRGFLQPGDNTLQLLLFQHGQLLAASPVVHIQFPAPPTTATSEF